ncbi:hypothetical protein [Mycolicibacterium aubagnense]|uniref:Uncharacterized protein n=1 Tax=Mycolicibacterium aubagnense TaxID=319707 RepID=A0ABM7I9U0_9MYCO|nr:hypothetical protein [Mycolicibacterium aubagnense]TLH59705.1 hypothetical protein C1S80_19685 [Mycolicibacterium aubagnense]WGI34433.1 hypothetical protein QDT91_08875 [Mycolicibacterium aubagnense]BBX83701.1 hypothetical protein MAUB_15740 [Mycolicibacterium aubagnense]
MTVHVTRDGGAIDEFDRFADRYIKHTDGSLEIVRLGSAQTNKYGAGCWVDVTGDEKHTRRAHFRDWLARVGVGQQR